MYRFERAYFSKKKKTGQKKILQIAFNFFLKNNDMKKQMKIEAGNHHQYETKLKTDVLLDVLDLAEK